MSNSTISTLIEIFNIFTSSVSVFFAGLGILALISIFYKKSTESIFHDRIFLSAFCIASLFALAAETTIFNFQHYLKYFADKEFYTTQTSPQNSDIILTSDGNVFAETVIEKKDETILSSGMVFKNTDRKITSIFVKPAFLNTEHLQMLIQWTDEESTREFTKTLYKGLPYENYTALQPCGKVSQLSIIFAGNGINEISQIAVNRQIPFYFSGLRLLVVSFLIFAAFIFANKKLHAKTSYYLFEYKFNPTSKKQNIIYAASVIFLILFSWFCVYTSLSKSQKEYPPYLQYNKFLVDAIIAKRTYLDYGNPEKLLNAERPYDTKWLVANGYERDVDWMWDWAYYKGKHYCYFGVVPAIILYVPWKTFTGNYLSNQAGVFLFSSVAIILLAILWRFLVKKYMPNARFIFYLLSFFTLFFASGLFVPLRYPTFYCIVQTAGFMFVIAAILLLFKSVENEKVNRLKLFFACFCFALVVGCRPNLIFASLLVPVVLWKYKTLKLFLFVLIPYIIVAIPLCLYNYARFDSIFDFGRNYCLTVQNLNVYDALNPIGKVIKIFDTSVSYLFFPNKYSLYFPFVESFTENTAVTMGFYQYKEIAGGMINFPIVFCLFHLFKNIFDRDKFKPFSYISTFLIISAVIIVSNSLLVGFQGRYIIDFAIFIVLASLFCAYYWQYNQSKKRMKVIYVLLAASIFVGLFLFVTGSHNYHYKNPNVYRYIEHSLTILRGI